jgi:hypothetical protein
MPLAVQQKNDRTDTSNGNASTSNCASNNNNDRNNNDTSNNIIANSDRFSPKKYTDPIVQRRAGGALILRM